jgi:hypothetical protein
MASGYKKLEFVFSLSSNEKINVKQGNKIHNFAGGHNAHDIGNEYFSICSKANSNKQSFLYIDEDGYDDNLLAK